MILGTLLAVFASVSTSVAKEKPAPIGTRIADFTLPVAGNDALWSLHKSTAEAKATVVLFLGTECPINNSYIPVLTKMHEDYKAKGVVFVAIGSNEHDTPAEIAKFAKEFKIAFPFLKDEKAAIADKFAAQRTPEAFVLDSGRVVRYRGRIDDQFGISVKRVAPTRKDLIEAIEQTLAEKEVSVPFTEVAGCHIGRPVKELKSVPAEKRVTYSKQISRLIQQNCQECHRPGEAGPFKLMNYKDALGWAEAIKENVTNRNMPPWHADPKHGKFLNDRRLSDADVQTFADWVDQGCPEGDPKELPEPRKYHEGWGIGKPDLVLSMKQPEQIPAQAGPRGLSYRYLILDHVFEEEKWVTAMECRPGNRAVVHHIIAFMVQPKREIKPDTKPYQLIIDQMDPKNPDGLAQTFLTAYAPGDQPTILDKKFGMKIPKGTRIIFEMHYTPNGIETTDTSSLGLVFAKEKPEKEVHIRGVANTFFTIPAGADNHKVTSQSMVDKDMVVLGFNPHMHVRGKSFQFESQTESGDKEMMISVPKYDFNWQTSYHLEKPKILKKGDKIVCTAHYDNSKNNPNNPDPTVAVRWGNQTWDEMMIGFMYYYYVD